MTAEEKDLIKRIYGLDSEQIKQAERLYLRSSFTVCGAAKIVKNRSMIENGVL